MNARLILIILLISPLLAIAQTDTIYHLDGKLIQKYLKPSTNQYLVFIQRKGDPRMAYTFVWSRDVKFVNKGGKELIEIDQKWYGSDTTRLRKVYSLMNANDFSPVYHRTVLNRSVEAFDFYSDKIVGSDSVANNTKSGFTLALEKPLLNWELDVETFPLLDLKAGKSFFISFYHPGGKTAPKLYEYKVMGDESVQVINGGNVPCWKLRIDYDSKSWAIFYISKKEREVLKMEEDFGGGVRYKVKLSNTVLIK
jgi:hypothetical protein